MEIEKLYKDYLNSVEKCLTLEEQAEQLKKQHQQELDAINAEINKILKNSPASKLQSILDYNNYGINYSCLTLAAYKMSGQNISTFDYYKNLLENTVGEKLVLMELTTPFQRNGIEWDEYESYRVKQTLVDTILAPKNVVEKLLNTSKKIELETYIKIIKKMPNVFLLNRTWAMDAREAKAIETSCFCFHLNFNQFKNYKIGIFQDDEYNKDTTYDSIVIKTYEYWVKSKKLEESLQKQEELKEKLSAQNNLKKQLAMQQAITKKAIEDLQR